MNSLQELNNFGSESLDYVDARPSGVIFDRQFPLTPVDQQLTINSTLLIPEPGINIAEIINYQTADVRYRVTIFPGIANPIIGSSVSWNNIPSGCTLTQVGDQYTISGIRSIADWEAIKYFNWALPANYASFPLWYLTVDIIYFDSELNEERTAEWLVYDDRFFYVAQLNATSSITAVVGVNSPANANLTASSSITAQMFNFIRFTANLTANATINADAKLNNTELFARSTLTSVIGVNSPATATLSARGTFFGRTQISVTNLGISRSYTENRGTRIFETSTPVVSGDSDTEIINVTLTSNVGDFGYLNDADEIKSTLQLSGTANAVNHALANVTFYPVKNSTQSGTITWQQTYKQAAQTYSHRSVAWSGSVYVTVGDTGTILSSSDGATWTARNVDGSYGLTKVIYAPGLFIAVGTAGRILTSPDGITWTQRTSGVTVTLNDVVYNGSIVVAVGEFGTILSSADAVTWTKRKDDTSTGFSSSLRKVIWQTGGTLNRFVVVGTGFGATAAAIYNSTNGTTWTARVNTGTYTDVAFYNDNLIAVGSGTGILTSSNGGDTWTTRTLTSDSNRRVLFNNDGTVAVIISDSRFYRSTNNGANWTEVNSGPGINYTGSFNSIARNASRFVIVGNDFQIRTSTDGLLWRLVSPGSPSEHQIQQVIWTGSEFIAVGTRGYIATSSDGLAWSLQNYSNLFTRTINLTGLASNYIPKYYQFTSPRTEYWTPTVSEERYGGKIDFILVAGGGHGGNSINGAPGGGGGGGGVREIYNFSVTRTNPYTLIIGAGGLRDVAGSVDPGSGQLTNGFGYESLGGKKGEDANPSISRGGSGGESGFPQSNFGASGVNRSFGGGGGGAASTSISGGTGGIGLLTTISQVSYYVAGGGGGGSNSSTQFLSGNSGNGTGALGAGGNVINNVGQNGQIGTLGGGGGGGGGNTGTGGTGGAGGNGFIAIRVRS
jgi:hypothetical protein